MKKNFHFPHYTAFALVALLMLVLWLHPTTSVVVFPVKRAQMLNSFLANIDATKSIDAQGFWQFREFYYPGTLIVDKSGIKDSSSPSIPLAYEPYLFTVFHSSKIASYEYLVTKNTLDLIVPKSDEWKIFPNSSLAYKHTDDSVSLVFIKPISEMVRANGFLDYKDKDKKLLDGKYWLVVTTIAK